MTDPIFKLKYEGGDADRHRIDMRLLGMSLEGADRVNSDGLLLLIHHRLPKRGERAPVLIKVREPVPGSVDYQGLYETALFLLPLGAPIASDLMSGYLEQWWLALKAHFTGKSEISEIAIQNMVAMQNEQLAARDAADSRAHGREMNLHQLIRDLIVMQQASLQKFAAPMGPSVTEAKVQHGERKPVIFDTTDADAIRESGKITWSKIQQHRLRTEGFRFHNNGLSIEHPDGDGYLMARVRDPAFEELENPYTLAAQRRSEIIVLGRFGYRDGRVVAVEIVEFESEAPA